MTREELQQLSKAELIEIILQLEEQIKRLTQPPKSSSNSSIPPSNSPKPNRLQCKRGPKPGHQGARRAPGSWAAVK